MIIRDVLIILSSLSLLFSYEKAFSQPKAPATKPYNIILIINDQERFDLAAGPDYQVPARQTLMRNGVTFRNHYNSSAMCSPSRASFLTGTTPQVNGVYDQMEYTFVPSLSPSRPNAASVLKKLGYLTAYFGKFEMDKQLLLDVKNTTNYSTRAEAYGIDVFNPDGDVGGTPQQGYHNDAYFVGEAIRWLRKNQAQPKKTSQPFFMVLSLLNPHDIMYADANLPNSPSVQKVPIPVILPPPKNAIYAKQWQITLPSTLTDSLTAPGMPNALLEYHNGWSGALGFIPTNRKDMWTYYSNYYLNLIRDNDQSLQQVIDAMNEMDLWKNTVIIFTADHGEMGGAHGGLRGKGPMAYENNTHIPLIIDHPDAPHGVNCVALTSHIDLLPTLVGVTGLPADTRAEAIKEFVGHDFSNLLINPEKMKLHTNRPGILFNYVGISTIDATFLKNKMVASFKHTTVPSLTEINLSKRGFLSFVFDGRYKFARYYAPNAFNTPKTLEQIFKYNDVQLFDLQTDPDEKYNLALDSEKNKDLILRMNQLLNDLMAKEVGVNNGDFLPGNVRPKSLPLTF